MNQNRDVEAVDRRTFLRYVGAGAAAIFSAGPLSTLSGCASSPVTTGAWVSSDGSPQWQPPSYPVPLPGDAAGDAARAMALKDRLATFEVVDELLLPEGFEAKIIAQWGDRLGANGHQIDFGYNNDYTGLVAIPGTTDEFWLHVNHEYICARPWLAAWQEVYGVAAPEMTLAFDETERWSRGIFSVAGWTSPTGDAIHVAKAEVMAEVPAEVRETLATLHEKVLAETGVSILRVRRLADGNMQVIGDATDHRRISAAGRQNVAAETIAASKFTGEAATLLTTPPRGTAANCSGGTSPWGTFLTCEENTNLFVDEDVSPAGQPVETSGGRFGAIAERVNGVRQFDDPRPFLLFGSGNGIEEPIDGREFGWVCEIEPTTGKMLKHTALGRFRHENVSLRCEAGKRLAAYMGDDRRGGHVWKFVSDGIVEDPASPSNSQLLEKGTLYVARFHEDFTGEWLPILPETKLRRPEPEHCYLQHIQVPSRPTGGEVRVGDTDQRYPELAVDDWLSIIEQFGGKAFEDCTLADLVQPEAGISASAVLLTDAFLMANACGGTPTARPEDIEIHPGDRSVYIAFTDATGSSDGSPDQRIFPDSDASTSRQYGAIYRLIEGGVESADSDPAATSFAWGKFVGSGEVAQHGGGFACADNMVFDPAGNLWMMTDISTSALNFPTSREAEDGSDEGGATFPGVFGNNALFMIPTTGPNAGVPSLFALAPMEAELCGPTFTDDGRTLILSIQHPGEVTGVRESAEPEESVYIVHDRGDQPFEQRRKVPHGSNFPHGELGRAPRPCVVSITRS